MRDRRIEARTWLEVRDIYLSKLKNREEFEEEKGGKEEKKQKSDKTHLKIPL